MNIDEIMKAYAEACEAESKVKKEKEYLKSLLCDYVKVNGIMNPETIEKEKVTFETENNYIMVTKNVQNRFDQSGFLAMFPDLKKDFIKPTLTISFTSTEKATTKTA